MGSFSSKSKTKNNDKAVAAALAPKPYYTPYGDFANNTYTPKESADQQGAREGSDLSLNTLAEQFNGGYTIDEAYSGPVYDMILGNANRQTDRAREQDYKQLQNNLSARNQIGSSYDAMMSSELGRNYSDQYANNEVGAFQNALSALSSNQTDNANLASIMSGINDQQYKRYYTPAAMAQGYQQAVSPLQTAQANYLTQQSLANGTQTTPWGPTAINAGLKLLMG